MSNFNAVTLPMHRDAVAPDGSDVRILLGLPGGGMAHFELCPGEVSRAVTHRTVEEIWFFLSSHAQMWRSHGGAGEIVDVFPVVCLTISLGTHFQFRATGEQALAAVGVTMPPWPGEDEAYAVEGPWRATV